MATDREAGAGLITADAALNGAVKPGAKVTASFRFESGKATVV
jgi:hypothetical protein